MADDEHIYPVAVIKKIAYPERAVLTGSRVSILLQR